MKRFFTIKIILFCLIFTIISGVFALEVEASSTSPETAISENCGQAQILLLIDQSASMIDRNDPNHLRDYAPVHLVDVIARNYLRAKQTSDVLLQPKEIEFAVVRFASSATVGLNWTRIAPASEEAWQTQRSDLEKKLDLSWEDERALLGTIGNGTNFVRAFEMAVDLFQEKDIPQNGCPERLILVLTDGKPDQSGAGMEGEALAQHMNDVFTIAKDHFWNEGTEIFVTGINVSGDNYWRDTVSFWADITQNSNEFEISRAEKANSQSDIGFRMTEIIRTSLDEGITTIVPGDFVVPPYVDRFILDFYKSDQEDLMILRDPQGNILTPDREDVEVVMLGENEAIQTIEVVRPEPGVYQLATTAQTEDYRITKVTIFVHAVLAKPQGHLVQFTESEIEVHLVDSDGNPLPDYGSDRYGLQITADLSFDGEKTPLNLAYDSKSSRLIGAFTPMQAGNYVLGISAVALDDESQPVEILAKDSAQFSLLVDPVRVNVADAHSSKPECPPTVNVPFNLDLHLINTSTGELVGLSLPVSWKYSSQTEADYRISGPLADGSYVLEVIPDDSGDMDIMITASAPDPVNASDYLFFETTKRISVSDSTEYVLENVQLQPKMGSFALAIDNFLNRISGNPQNRSVVVGRRFFFFRQDILVYADFINMDTNAPGELDLLPSVSLVREDALNEVYTSSKWNRDAQGRFFTKMDYDSFGDYELVVNPQETACNVVLTTIPSIGAWRISPGISERVLFLLGVLLLLFSIFLLIRFLLCRFHNQLYGVIAIVSPDGKALYKSTITGRSCWTIKPTPPNKYCMVRKIKINGMLKANDNFLLKVEIITNSVENKTEKIKREVSLSNWRPVILPNACRIDWKRNSSEF
jgi:hypothetical protein